MVFGDSAISPNHAEAEQKIFPLIGSTFTALFMDISNPSDKLEAV